VHIDFGIARFDGLVKLEVGTEADYLLLSYRDGDRLYLPVTRMNLLQKYLVPEGIEPALSKLGGKTWEKTKQRVKQVLLEIADELIKLEASRRKTKGIQAEEPGEEYNSLAASFPFDETDDQKQAIIDVIDDMTRARNMDRLICGDVGFGKTEVAVRASYLNALSNRQTAVLVPTTLLALQHLATFKARLEPAGLRVEMLSRMTLKNTQKTIVEDLPTGKIDVIVGTHRLLAKDILFKEIGLIVIDEEQRFGVRHKEKLKQLKENIDVLTMTATPLPRTLQMSLTGLRDISVIRTPPLGRRSIRTFISRFSEEIIVESITRERRRGGQVFFVHNFVKSLPAMKRLLNRIVPEARVAIAHGQMGERELEQAMYDFVSREVDVLLCSSIIESGLDIPSANTIIVNRADRFGLSQLYQMRGRVGRSAERAYAYFLIPGLTTISSDARKRLEALADNTELGSGYKIASRDLEIRGAGNLLGKAQSGNIKAIGFEMYNRLLEKAVLELKGQFSEQGQEPEMKLPVAGFLPEDYVPELNQRLDFYDRLSRSQNEDEVYELEQEIRDRFGPTGPEVENLIELTILKTQLRRAKILLVEIRQGVMLFQIDLKQLKSPDSFILFAKNHPDKASLDPAGILRFKLSAEEKLDSIQTARTVMSRISRYSINT